MRSGFTLLEMIVVLALFGLVLSLSALAITSLAPDKDEQRHSARVARADAIRFGSPRVADSVLFLPDGRAVGAGVDPLTGAARAR
ncbi:MAG: type II secretion system protein [Chloroflexi bacterium]|nr:MAG: type II secretion system protein [Chloroflexota bacterium]